ncbi:hypothetical protein KO506_10320 [Polaribacter vadi]|uniref:carboxypeptidase-like regulatory domain-containing protein n=1 Tax=Polaribacter TaxID=52959 RepID=UPI001C0841AD|nr:MULTISPECIES: carboxypeptidase-like regulatory domain-containing protein [Polaribacter]MBU3011799.1 hypothetical protein [Polaribacter vadi]MDO6741612.1 hypothetical protein [Polaribacter sp. 1_MG-2023]
MRNPILFCCLFLCTVVYSQEKRKVITGEVFFNDEAITDAHIINKNSNQGASTNDFGLFEIPVKIGDVLTFSHINLKKEEVTITQEILDQEIFVITLKGKTYELEEIVLEKPKSIFYVDPEIMPPPTVNAKTLNLPYANTIAKKDTRIAKLTLTSASVSLDNLINSLNGNLRRERELKKIKLEDKALSKIRKHFTDDFFITDLNIKPENINPFLNYCYKKNIINYYNKEDNLAVTRILMQESRTFPQNKTEITLLEEK